jgi:hypothetical protein
VRTYLYCLLTRRAERAPDGLRGVSGAPVRVVPVGPIAAWVSDVGEAPATTAENARAHDRVVRAAMEIETPLPARFGQLFDSEEAARAAVLERRDGIMAALRKVEGGCEMTVRILAGKAEAAEASAAAVPAGGAPAAGRAAPGPTRGGREYLDRLRARHSAERSRREEAEFLHDRVRRAVAGLVREEARAPAFARARSIAVSHLIARGDVSRYRTALRTLQETEPALRVMVSGPWAPYSFAELERV